jgi:hypothetical protein
MPLKRAVLGCRPFICMSPRRRYGVMVLISGFQVEISKSCPKCGTCQLLGALIKGFDGQIPEMQNVCIAMSSPLAMIICLFLMMSRKERRRLLFNRYFEEDDIEKGAAIMNAKMGIDFPRGS